MFQEAFAQLSQLSAWTNSAESFTITAVPSYATLTRHGEHILPMWLAFYALEQRRKKRNRGLSSVLLWWRRFTTTAAREEFRE